MVHPVPPKNQFPRNPVFHHRGGPGSCNSPRLGPLNDRPRVESPLQTPFFFPHRPPFFCIVFGPRCPPHSFHHTSKSNRVWRSRLSVLPRSPATLPITRPHFWGPRNPSSYTHGKKDCEFLGPRRKHAPNSKVPKNGKKKPLACEKTTGGNFVLSGFEVRRFIAPAPRQSPSTKFKTSAVHIDSPPACALGPRWGGGACRAISGSRPRRGFPPPTNLRPPRPRRPGKHWPFGPNANIASAARTLGQPLCQIGIALGPFLTSNYITGNHVQKIFVKAKAPAHPSDNIPAPPLGPQVPRRCEGGCCPPTPE